MAVTVMNTSRFTYVWVGIEASTFALKNYPLVAAMLVPSSCIVKFTAHTVSETVITQHFSKAIMYKSDRK